MNKNDVANSIFLTGPACVGKSLVSGELSKKLNMEVVSIDDLIMFVQYEQYGWLGPSVKKQNEFVNTCIRDIKKDKKLSKNLLDKDLSNKVAQMLHNFVANYVRYVNLFGGLKHFYKIVDEYDRIKVKYEKDIEWISCYAAVSTMIIEKCINLVDKPLIFDTPAMFGWKLDETKISNKYKNYLSKSSLHIDLNKINKLQYKIFQTSKTVFLEPGLDYPIRNMARGISGNNLLLKHLDNYFDLANISITTNGMFNHPENKYFKQRSWFDAKEYAVKEKLKNKGNIANICDEIIFMINGLNEDLKV